MAFTPTNMQVLPQAATPNMEVYKNKFDQTRNSYYKNKQMYHQMGLAMKKDELLMADKYAEAGIVPNAWNGAISTMNAHIDNDDFAGLDGAIEDAAYSYATNDNLIMAKYNSSVKEKGDSDIQQLMLKGDTTLELGRLLKQNQQVPDIDPDTGTIAKMPEYDLGVKYTNPQPMVNALMARVGRTIQEGTDVDIDTNSIRFEPVTSKKDIPDTATPLIDSDGSTTGYFDSASNSYFYIYNTTERGSLPGGLAMTSTLNGRERWIMQNLVNDDAIIGYYNKLAIERNKAGEFDNNNKPWTGEKILRETVVGIAPMARSEKKVFNDKEIGSFQSGGIDDDATPTESDYLPISVTVTPEGESRATVESIVLAAGNHATNAHNATVDFEKSKEEILDIQDVMKAYSTANPTADLTNDAQYQQYEQNLQRAVIKMQKAETAKNQATAAWKLNNGLIHNKIGAYMIENGIERYGKGVLSADQAKLIYDSARYLKIINVGVNGGDPYEGAPEWARYLGLLAPTKAGEEPDYVKMNVKLNDEISTEIEKDVHKILNSYLPISLDAAIAGLEGEMSTWEGGFIRKDNVQTLKEYARRKLVAMGYGDEYITDAKIQAIERTIRSTLSVGVDEFNSTYSKIAQDTQTVTANLMLGDDALDGVNKILNGIKASGSITGSTYSGTEIITDSPESDYIKAILKRDNSNIQLTNSSYGGQIGAIVSSVNSDGVTESAFLYLDAVNSANIIGHALNQTDLSVGARRDLEFMLARGDNGEFFSTYARDFDTSAIGDSNINDIYGTDVEIPDVYDFIPTEKDEDGNVLNGRYANDYGYAANARKSPPMHAIKYKNTYINWLKQGDDEALIQLIAEDGLGGYTARYLVFDDKGELTLSYTRPTAEELRNKTKGYVNNFRGGMLELKREIDEFHNNAQQ